MRQQTAADAAAKAADEEALKQVEHESDLLNTRMAASDASLNTMKDAQSRQGYGLRADIASAQERLHMNLLQAGCGDPKSRSEGGEALYGPLRSRCGDDRQVPGPLSRPAGCKGASQSRALLFVRLAVGDGGFGFGAGSLKIVDVAHDNEDGSGRNHRIVRWVEFKVL